MQIESMSKNDKRTIFGWCMYDWANSAYATTVLAGLLPAYFADGIVGVGNKVDVFGQSFSATSLWAFAVAGAATLAFVLAPILGAIADFSAAKKRFLLTFAFTGSLFTLLLYLCTTGEVLQTLVFFVIAQFSFISGNVFYDAFLPQIATEDRADGVSGRGYAFGYIGGGLQFALALGLIAGNEALGMSLDLAARIGLAMAGLWWGGFTLFIAFLLREPPPLESLPPEYANRWRPLAYASIGLRRTLGTARRVGRFKHLVLFLLAFMLYNDGIQTVIAMATIYGKDELGISTTSLMVTLLIIQGVAAVGAYIFGKIALRIGTKPAVMVTLVLWSAVVIFAYFITTATEYFLLGGMVGLILGGAQALSRSFYSSMIPENASAEFFGFYTVFSKFSAIWGPLAFGLIDTLTGSTRLSIVSLIVFFLSGLILLYFVDVDKAREAKKAGAF
jgi:UMF1 family MFS transporter